MKHIKSILILLIMATLVGCGKEDDVVNRELNSYVERAVIEQSDIKSDDGYKKYEELFNSDAVNDDGFYTTEDIDNAIVSDPEANHITFANNSYLSIDYYADPGKSCLLDSKEAYLFENDCIYAEVKEINNPNTDAYGFYGFEVWEFDENGNKKGRLDTEYSETGFVYQIPEGFKCKEICIIPLGEYKLREIKLTDYYKDNNGEQVPLDGVWEIDGQVALEGSAFVNPVASYAVTYNYDADLYEVINTEPSCLYNNVEEGTVSFELYSSDQKINEFNVELHKKDGDIEFDPQKYSIEHAVIEYKRQGVVIDGIEYIPEGTKVAYEITSVDDGYWIPSGESSGEIEVELLTDKIRNLVCEQEYVTVYLSQPEKGGTISYSIDGKKIYDESVNVLIGTEILMEFNPKNGWFSKAKDGTKYIVSNIGVQRININVSDSDGSPILIEGNEVFEEQYKPNIKVELNKSVGTNTDITFKGDYEENSEDASKNDKLIFDKYVGTSDDFLISVANYSLLENEALRFDVLKEKIDGTKENDIQYMKKTPNDFKVSLYNANSNVVYSNIKVIISKVNTVTYKGYSVKNGYVSVKTTDLTNNRYLKPGEVIEDNRKVELTISPKYGYYVKNCGVNPTYTKTAKFSKIIEDMDSVLNKHHVGKICVVTLDTSDPYGNVIYKIDGKNVEAGEYKLTENNKLEICYEITDGKHIIARDSKKWTESIWDKTKRKDKETVDIEILSTLDGSVITREMYIKVENK